MAPSTPWDSRHTTQLSTLWCSGRREKFSMHVLMPWIITHRSRKARLTDFSGFSICLFQAAQIKCVWECVALPEQWGLSALSPSSRAPWRLSSAPRRPPHLLSWGQAQVRRKNRRWRCWSPAQTLEEMKSFYKTEMNEAIARVIICITD